MRAYWAVPVIASILILGTLAPAFGIVYNPPIIIPNPNPGVDDYFGWAVAISGNNVLVGSPFDDTPVTNSGAAYLFDGTTGGLVQTFLNPTPGAFDEFGRSVAISGNNVLIGARHDDTSGTNHGIAYLFDATTGGLVHTFTNPSPGGGEDLFGWSVAISGNNVLIGVLGEDDPVFNSGIAYLYDATTGGLVQTFHHPGPQTSFDHFGQSASISGNNVLIGAPGVPAPGVVDSGKAYLFDATTGGLLKTFSNPTPVHPDVFGITVSISGNNVLIGAPFITPGSNAGTAYLYDATTGGLVHTFTNPTGVDDYFGESVSISGNNILIEIPETNSVPADTGAGYLYDATTGGLVQTFLSPTPGGAVAGDEFHGVSVGISGNNVLIGVQYDDTGATNSGAAYLFLEDTSPETPQEQMQDLIDDIGAELPEDIAQSLAAPLENAIKLLDDNNPNNDSAVCGKLGAVDNKIDAKEGKKNGLTSEQADALRAALESINTALGCV